MANDTKQDIQQKKPGKGCLAFIMAVVLCAIILTVVSLTSDNTSYHVEVACTTARNQGYICNPETVLGTWPEAVKTCEELVNDPIDYDFYVFCLQNEGVNMGR